MVLPFRRVPRSAAGAASVPFGVVFASAQRIWEVRALLSTLSPQVQRALGAWLILPTDLDRWPPPTTFSATRLPLRQDEIWDQPVATVCDLLREELRAIRQTLDFPPEALSGLTRNGLLTVHAIRLRQLEWRLWPRFTARQIRRIIQ